MSSSTPQSEPVDYLDLYAVPEVDDLVDESSCSDPAVPSSRSRALRRLSLQVSADLHRQLKLIAMEDEETMNSMVVRILRQFLRQREAQLQAARPRRSI